MIEQGGFVSFVAGDFVIQYLHAGEHTEGLHVLEFDILFVNALCAFLVEGPPHDVVVPSPFIVAHSSSGMVLTPPVSRGVRM